MPLFARCFWFHRLGLQEIMQLPSSRDWMEKKEHGSAMGRTNSKALARAFYNENLNLVQHSNMRTKLHGNPTTPNFIKREVASHLNNGSKTGLGQTYTVGSIGVASQRLFVGWGLVWGWLGSVSQSQTFQFGDATKPCGPMFQKLSIHL